jgi:hypothetical protein
MNAIATTIFPHGFANADLVVISGATGPDRDLYNGTQTITGVLGPNSFQYLMEGIPSGPGNSSRGRPFGLQHVGQPLWAAKTP